MPVDKLRGELRRIGKLHGVYLLSPVFQQVNPGPGVLALHRAERAWCCPGRVIIFQQFGQLPTSWI
jgi:hypothetical protein